MKITPYGPTDLWPTPEDDLITGSASQRSCRGLWTATILCMRRAAMDTVFGDGRVTTHLIRGRLRGMIDLHGMTGERCLQVPKRG